MDWLTRVDRVPPIRIDAGIYDVFDALRRHKKEGVFPVVDDGLRPVGVVREYDLKDYSYAPYGRELIRKKIVADFVCPCPCVPEDAPAEEVLRLAGEGLASDGLLVTSEGRYLGLMKPSAVLGLYAAHRAESEERILQLQRIESIGTLAGGIAHELNNVLTPIMGHAELALDHVSPEDRAHRSLSRILAAARRASDIVRQILVFSRADEGGRFVVDLRQVVAEGLGLLQATLPSTIQVLRREPAAEALVRADPTQLQQVLVNLCTNAAQAIGSGHGTIEIEVSELNPPAARDAGSPRAGPQVRLSVRDSGCGMSGEVLARAFEPFFTTKPVGEGTGLGLALVHGIVRNHGGSVTVDSRPGEGTAVEVLFPAAQRGDPSPPVANSAVPRGEGCILFVDDEEGIVEIGREILSGLGYRVVSTTRSQEALELFRERPEGFDLVITDQTMPGLTGEFLARSLLAIRPDVPVLLCSGYADGLSAEGATAMGIREFLPKPVSRAALAQAVSRALQVARPRPAFC